MRKSDLIQYLDLILDSNMAQHHTYLRWCRGFGPELDANERIAKKGFEHLPTGWFLYYENSKSHLPTKSYYCTMSSISLNDKIVELYSRLSRYADNLFYIHYNFDKENVKFIDYSIKDSDGNNSTTKIPELSLDIYQFIDEAFVISDLTSLKTDMDRKRIPVCNRKSSGKELLYLENYDYALILDIYAQRYLLSHLFRDCKGYACDIDHIGFLNEELVIIESKSKDPAGKKVMRNGKNNDSSKWYFGWDWRRFAHYMELYYNTKIDTIYLIEELNNQQERTVEAYKQLKLSEILKQSSWGEAGDTNNIPYNAFYNF